MAVAIGYFEDKKAGFTFHSPEEWLEKLNEAGAKIKTEQAALKAQNGKKQPDSESEPDSEIPTLDELDQMKADITDAYAEDKERQAIVLTAFDEAVEVQNWTAIQDLWQAALDQVGESHE
jgi:hypothetical protein